MIREINISGLFDRYDYNIRLHDREGDAITYITGCNGLGKSTILRILNMLFTQNWSELVLQPFAAFELVMSDISIRVVREYESSLRGSDTLDINSRVDGDYVLYMEHGKTGDKPLRCRIGRYDENYYQVPSNVSMALEVNGCYYIDDQRLAVSGDAEEAPLVNACMADCRRKLGLLKFFVDEKVSPFYVSRFEVDTHPSLEARQAYFTLYDNLIHWGLLAAKESRYLNPGSKEEANVTSTMSVLRQEINAYKQIRDIYVSLVKLEEMVATYEYDHKTLQYRLDNGIRFISSEGKILRVNQLSSGEKQILIQLYELLFNAPDGSAVLVDEPETSQHVGWQMEYYQNIRKIAAMKNLQFIIATHLPIMFDDDFSLSVDLYRLAHPEEFQA